MAFAGHRKTLPHSHYGIDLDILLDTGWTWQELQAQPADLIDELRIRYQKHARYLAKKAKK